MLFAQEKIYTIATRKRQDKQQFYGRNQRYKGLIFTLWKVIIASFIAKISLF